MKTVRLRVTLPPDLVRDVDRLVGREQRSAFIARAVERAVGQPPESIKRSAASHPARLVNPRNLLDRAHKVLDAAKGTQRRRS